jgi:geranylgeranyl diphosphate synthase, type I
MSTATPTLDELKRAVDDEIASFLSTVGDELPDSLPLVGHIQRLLTAGGKRLRPAFCYWGFRAGGGTHRPEIVRASSALELLHTFALVHDDIMDAAETRRGEPTVHSVAGVDVAILVGDLALVLADAQLVESGFNPESIKRCLAHYSRMRKEVIVGQFLDVNLSEQALVDEQVARHVARMKSGRYSVREPLLIGAALARAEPIVPLERFGELVGEAFQLRDDLLGTFGDPSETGKPVDSDIREGKKNVLFAKTLRGLVGDEREFFETHWGGGQQLTGDDCLRLRALIESSGARKETEDLLDRLTAESRTMLESLAVDEAVRSGLGSLVEAATSRTS